MGTLFIPDYVVTRRTLPVQEIEETETQPRRPAFPWWLILRYKIVTTFTWRRKLIEDLAQLKRGTEVGGSRTWSANIDGGSKRYVIRETMFGDQSRCIPPGVYGLFINETFICTMHEEQAGFGGTNFLRGCNHYTKYSATIRDYGNVFLSKEELDSDEAGQIEAYRARCRPSDRSGFPLEIGGARFG